MTSAMDKLKVHGVSPLPSKHSLAQASHLTSKRGNETYTSQRIKEQITKLLDDEMAKGTYNLQATKAPPVVHKMAFLAKLRSVNSDLTPVDTGGLDSSDGNKFVLHGRRVQQTDDSTFGKKQEVNRDLLGKSLDSKSLKSLRSSGEKDVEESYSVSSLPTLNASTAAGFSRSLQSWGPHSVTSKGQDPCELEILQAPLLASEHLNSEDYNFGDLYNPNFVNAWEEPEFYYGRTKPKRGNKRRSKTETPNAADLETCLSITRSSHQSKAGEESTKLKHSTQYMLRPLSQTSLTNSITPRRETPELKPSNYYFGSVESYLNFRNRQRIQFRKTDHEPPSLNGSSLQRHVGRTSYSDTSVLRLLSDKNKAKSPKKSSVLYSEVVLPHSGSGSTKIAEVNVVGRQRHASYPNLKREFDDEQVYESDEEPWPGAT